MAWMLLTYGYWIVYHSTTFANRLNCCIATLQFRVLFPGKIAALDENCILDLSFKM